jgi:hypothetical protein
VNSNPSGALGSTDHALVQFGALPLKDGARSLTVTGEPVSGRLLGSLAADALPVSEGFTLRPTTGGLFWGDYGVILDFQPTSRAHTRMRCQWLVSAEAEEGRDYDRTQLIELWDTTNSQDRSCARSSSRVSPPGVFGPGRTATTEKRASVTSASRTWP